MINPYHKQLELFKSLFKGRSDVFATRWEKDGKSGYMPVYSFDPYRFMAHKRNGGTFQNYPDKSYLALSDEQYSKHLNGEQLVGLYPLLEDNTSWFIVSSRLSPLVLVMQLIQRIGYRFAFQRFGRRSENLPS